MKLISPFDFDDYRDYLAKQFGARRGSLGEAARVVGCQKSHLSRVLHKTHHLTPEQGFAVTEYLNMAPIERDYFLAQLDLQRSGSRAHQAHLREKLRELKKQRASPGKIPQAQKLESPDFAARYYSSWHWGAIHVMLGIPGFRTIEAIASHLELPQALVKETLQGLESFGLVTQVESSGKWSLKVANLHLEGPSPMKAINHQNWRSRAVTSILRGRADGLHYTLVAGISREAYSQLRLQLSAAIQQAAELSESSKEEILVGMNVDLFEV